MYPIMAMIMSVIHESGVYCFGVRALFLLLNMGIPTSRMIYIWLVIGYLQILSIPCSLAPSLHSISVIFCIVFHPSSFILTSHFRGHILYLYFPPLDVKRNLGNLEAVTLSFSMILSLLRASLLLYA
jgi:hypothetical protein